MDEYKTRLYAIACRAPITEVHRGAVKECPLYTQFKERKKLRDSRVEYVVGLLKDHCKWDSDQGIMVRHKFSQFVLLDYSLISDDLVRWVRATSFGRVTLAQELYMSYKQAHAALAYAEAIINTPEEYLTLALPVDEDIPRAILSLPEYATQMQKCIDELFDEEESVYNYNFYKHKRYGYTVLQVCEEEFETLHFYLYKKSSDTKSSLFSCRWEYQQHLYEGGLGDYWS